MTLNRSRSQSIVSFDSSYGDMKIASSQMKHHFLQSYDEEQAYMSQIISVIQDGQKQEKMHIQELNGGIESLNEADDCLDEIQSVKADVDEIDQKPQLLKIKISLQDQIIVGADQQMREPNGNLYVKQNYFNSLEAHEIKQIKIMNEQQNLKWIKGLNQNQEQTKTTVEAQQLQSLDHTAISSQVNQQILNKESKKKYREKKDKKKKNEKRKYSKRKSPQEKKTRKSRLRQMTKEACQAQIQMIQELIEQNMDDDKIRTQTTLQEDKQNKIESHLQVIQNKERYLNSKLAYQITQVPIRDANMAQQKKVIAQATKIPGKKIRKPKSDKTKSEDKIVVQKLLQDKQKMQNTPSISFSKQLAQNIYMYKCDKDNCVRTFSTKQGLSLHKTRYHKQKQKSQLSIKKAEHQSCKQIYKQIYPEDTRYNPIKLAELKQGMKIQS